MDEKTDAVLTMISTASVFDTKIRFAYLAILYVPSLLSRLDNNGGIGPVSYTHLDVYKRQVLLSPVLF